MGTKTFHKILRGTSAKKVEKHWFKVFIERQNNRLFVNGVSFYQKAWIVLKK